MNLFITQTDHLIACATCTLHCTALHHIGCSFHSNRTRYHWFPSSCARALKAVQCQTKIYQSLPTLVGLGLFLHLHSETFLPYRQMTVAIAALHSLPLWIWSVRFNGLRLLVCAQGSIWQFPALLQMKTVMSQMAHDVTEQEYGHIYTQTHAFCNMLTPVRPYSNLLAYFAAYIYPSFKKTALIIIFLQVWFHLFLYSYRI